MVKATARQPRAQSAAVKRTSSAGDTGDSAGTAKPSRPPTAFEARLYAVCKCIPPGKVSTYGALAEVLHSAPRACGQVSRRGQLAEECCRALPPLVPASCADLTGCLSAIDAASN